MKLTTFFYYKDSVETSAKECLNTLHDTSLNINYLLGMKKTWYEKGYSRKEALKYIVMDVAGVSNQVIEKWEKRCKKHYPILVEGVWDGEDDNNSCSMSYMRRTQHHTKKTTVEVNINDTKEVIDVESMVLFITSMMKGKKDAYSFTHNNGYWFNDRNVFPDRIPCGWMLYVPHVVLAELVPEAARIVPVMDEDDKQKGTIIISTENVFDGSKKEHIEKSNDIEIRLLDLGLLPLMTEL